MRAKALVLEPGELSLHVRPASESVSKPCGPSGCTAVRLFLIFFALAHPGNEHTSPYGCGRGMRGHVRHVEAHLVTGLEVPWAWLRVCHLTYKWRKQLSD